MKQKIITTMVGTMLVLGALLLVVSAILPAKGYEVELLDVKIPSTNGKPNGGLQPAQTTPLGILKIKADQVWSKTTGSGINVAVIDTGIQADHPDLQANIKGGVNFVPTARSWNDDNGHGTHVAGTIAALNNAIGVVGAAPNVNLYAVKVLDRTGRGLWSYVVNGINWAVSTHSDADSSNDINVITMSLGGSSAPVELENAVNNAYNAGIVIVAAAGNEGDGNIQTTEISYPAAYSNVIAVGAIDSNENAPYWSNTGSYVDFVAPGVSIYSTYKRSTYATMSGTSMATPHVTATVALLLSVYPNLGPSGVYTKLKQTAKDLGSNGFDNQYGWGLIDALAAST